MTASPASALFRGHVMHARLRPRRHRFSYRVFFLRFDLAQVDAGPARRVLDRLGLVTFRRGDHGPRDGSALRPWIDRLLAAEGIAAADGAVELQAFPRMLGYVFNPVSFWLCHDRAGALRAVLCEVNNTFGEHHNYLVAHADASPIRPGDTLEARKVFHVSPFCRVEGRYRFRFDPAPADTRFRIDYEDADGKLLVTSITGQAAPLTAGTLTRCCFAYPWMSLGVMLRIHWQALRLWLTGVPFHRKPPPPARETTR